MKKFGTPMGAAPGRAKENVGLAGVGTPPLPVGGGALGAAAGALGVVPGVFGVGFAPGFLLAGGGEGCLDGCCPVPGPVGRGGGGGGVVPVGVVRVGGGGDVVLVVGLPVPVVVVTMGVEVVPVVADGHDSATVFTGPGRASDETGAPGGSVKYSVWPVISVTVTVQLAADAVGNAAIADVASTVLAVASAIFSFLRINTVAFSPPAGP
jgi:hypothetical protein